MWPRSCSSTAGCTASSRSSRARWGFESLKYPCDTTRRKYGSSKYRSSKILTELPDLLTLFFLVKYTRRPLHFFGKIGSVLLAVGFAVLTYLTFLWIQGHPIGTRPLLTLGVLLTLVGGQIVFTGLLADLIVNIHEDRRQKFPLKYNSDMEEAPERVRR